MTAHRASVHCVLALLSVTAVAAAVGCHKPDGDTTLAADYDRYVPATTTGLLGSGAATGADGGASDPDGGGSSGSDSGAGSPTPPPPVPGGHLGVPAGRITPSTDPVGQCDVCVNGRDNCGQPCGSGTGGGAGGGSCGSPGECPCSLGDSALVGYCPSRPSNAVCTYCPPGTTSEGPCSSRCVVDQDVRPPPSAVSICPAGYPVDCNGSCCPSDHGACCANKNYCGSDYSACQAVDEGTSSSSSSSSGGGGGGSGGSCAPTACQSSLSRASLKAGCCTVVGGGCLASCADACGVTWYEARGRIYGTCAAGDQACLQQAASGAIAACQ